MSMYAYQLIIEAKVKHIAFGIVAPDDFRYREGDAIDARIVIEQPNISLYCLDHANQRAIFVQTPADHDPLHAPFYFLAQYETAQRLIAVPYSTLSLLASEIQLDSSRIILVYSTGRCGSTLVSRVCDQIDDVASFSEPDVFSQLIMLRAAGQADDPAIVTLLRDCLKVMCAQTRAAGKEHWVFKFRSYVTSLGDLLYQAVPEAKLVFLYRAALPWAISFSRAFGPSDEALATLVQRSHRWMVPLVGAYTASHTEPMPYPQFLAAMWVSSMQDALAIQRQGAAMFAARYEDISVAPREVIAALLLHCGISAPDPALLDRTLAEDSQAGTVADRAETRRQAARSLTEQEVEAFNRAIHTYDSTVAPDIVIPQTFRP